MLNIARDRTIITPFVNYFLVQIVELRDPQRTALIQTSSHTLTSNFICLASREHCKICFKHILQRLDEANSQCAAYQLFIDSINLH